MAAAAIRSDVYFCPKKSVSMKTGGNFPWFCEAYETGVFGNTFASYRKYRMDLIVRIWLSRQV